METRVNLKYFVNGCRSYRSNFLQKSGEFELTKKHPTITSEATNQVIPGALLLVKKILRAS